MTTPHTMAKCPTCQGPSTAPFCRYPGHEWGRGILFEVKVPGKKPSPEQVEMHAELMLAGAIVRVVDNPDDVAAFFATYDAQMASEAAGKELREVWR